MSAKGVNLELRTALEPWHVLGENPPAATRSSTSTAARWNGCGQGLRAWWTPPRRHLQPASSAPASHRDSRGIRRSRGSRPGSPGCLPLHRRAHPLVFDLLDTWSAKSLGCPAMSPIPTRCATTPPSRSTATRPKAAGALPPAAGHLPGTVDEPPAGSNRNSR
ncbi:MAG: transglutaminase family protein [Kiritimatiellia bacterium]